MSTTASASVQEKSMRLDVYLHDVDFPFTGVPGKMTDADNLVDYGTKALVDAKKKKSLTRTAITDTLADIDSGTQKIAQYVHKLAPYAPLIPDAPEISIASQSDPFFTLRAPVQSKSPTFKFLGMDVDNSFNAVVVHPLGNIVACPMYSADAVSSIVVQNSFWSKAASNMNSDVSFYADHASQEDAILTYKDSSVVSLVANVRDYAKNVPIEAVRAFMTMIKMGGLEKITSYEDDDYAYSRRGVTVGDFSEILPPPMLRLSQGDMYNSILLNILKTNKEQQNSSEFAAVANKDTKTGVFIGVDDPRPLFMFALSFYWQNITSVYYQMLDTAFVVLDKWQNLSETVTSVLSTSFSLLSSAAIADVEDNEVSTTVDFTGYAQGRTSYEASPFNASVASMLTDSLAPSLFSYSYSEVSGFYRQSGDAIPDDYSPSVFALPSIPLDRMALIAQSMFNHRSPIFNDRLFEVADSALFTALGIMDGLTYADEDAELIMSQFDLTDAQELEAYTSAVLDHYDEYAAFMETVPPHVENTSPFSDFHGTAPYSTPNTAVYDGLSDVVLAQARDLCGAAVDTLDFAYARRIEAQNSLFGVTDGSNVGLPVVYNSVPTNTDEPNTEVTPDNTGISPGDENISQAALQLRISAVTTLRETRDDFYKAARLLKKMLGNVLSDFA